MTTPKLYCSETPLWVSLNPRVNQEVFLLTKEMLSWNICHYHQPKYFDAAQAFNIWPLSFTWRLEKFSSTSPPGSQEKPKKLDVWHVWNIFLLDLHIGNQIDVGPVDPCPVTAESEVFNRVTYWNCHNTGGHCYWEGAAPQINADY